MPADKFILNNQLPALFVDSLVSDVRDDNVHLLRFGARLPEGLYEQVRLIIQAQDLRNVIDGLCQQSNYYPIKPPAAKRTVKKKSSKSK